MSLIALSHAAKQIGIKPNELSILITQDKIPAISTGKKWFVNEEHIELYLALGGMMPEDMKICNVSLDGEDAGPMIEVEPDNGHVPKGISSICTFAGHEVGKMIMAPQSTRYPIEWGPRIRRIINKVCQYEGLQSNFIRDAVWNRVLDLEYLIEKKTHDTDPAWRLHDLSVRALERNNMMKKTVENMQKAVRALKMSKNKSKFEEYKKAALVEINQMEQPWKKMALSAFKGSVKSSVEEDTY